MYHELEPDALMQGKLEVDSWQVMDDLWFTIDGGDDEFTLSYTWGRSSHKVDWLQYYPLKDIRFSAPVNSLTVQPRLANRAIIARPNRPLYLPAGQGIRMFIGSPIWLNFQQDENQLIELPVAQLSDTWFGPNTRQGELCYASETHARFSLEGVKTNPWKALTSVHLMNSGEDGMQIERVNIPVPNLSLYQSDSQYWTSAVRVTRTSAADTGEVKVSGKPPADALNPIKIADPREKLDGGVVKRAMGLMFG